MRRTLALVLVVASCAAPARREPEALAVEVLARGLRPNERAVFAAREVDDAFAELRVVDAATCRPLEGARVETWTEDGTPPAMLPMLVDDARTARDGSVRVRWRAGEGRAANFRVSKGGYESLVTSTPLGETVWLHRAVPLRGRVLDLDLAPVEGAVVRTRQCCAHAISAASTRTDADGFFVLEDVPLGEDEGAEVEVISSNHVPRIELDPLVLRQIGEHDPLSSGRGATILTPRAAPWRVRLLDRDGKPLAHRRVATPSWRPVVSTWTDAEGVCELPPPLEDGISVETMDAGEKLVFVARFVPRTALVSLHPTAVGGKDLTDRSASSMVALELVTLVPHWNPTALHAAQWPVAFFPASKGVVVDAPQDLQAHLTLAPGKYTLVAGRDFSGWRERALEVDVQPGDTALRVELENERWMLLSLPTEKWLWLAVQTDACGFAQFGTAPVFESGHVFVPRVGRVAVCIERPDGELLLEHSEYKDPTGFREDILDMTGAWGDPIEPKRVGFAAQSPEPVRETPQSLGLPTDAQDVHGTAWIAGEGSKEFDAEGLELSRGRWYFAIVSARGLCPVHVLRRAGDPPAARAVRSARVLFAGNVTTATAFGRELDGAEGREHAFEYEGVPGPLRVLVTRNDGSVVRVDLELEPGDERELAFP